MGDSSADVPQRTCWQCGRPEHGSAACYIETLIPGLIATTSGPSLEPPEPPPACTWCDGDKRVVVAQVLTAIGLQRVSTRWGMYHEVDCPNCENNPGVEPALDPRDDPALDDRVKERRAEERA